VNKDIEIIKSCKSGDVKSQHELFMKYSEMLYSTCVRYMGNEYDAKDVLQESFIRIFKYIRNFDFHKGSLKNWMIKICVNESLKSLNKNKLETIDFDEIKELKKEPEIDSILEYNQLFETIQLLKHPYRTVVNLYMVEGYSHNEIADFLGIKSSSSRSILTRAKIILRQRIFTNKKVASWTI